jgi:uncharacterized protein YodC (DUF2158 family)
MSTTQKFKIGDAVQHKSGGPRMIVKGYEPQGSDQVVCEWFDKNTLHEKAFNQEVLMEYRTPSFF